MLKGKVNMSTIEDFEVCLKGLEKDIEKKFNEIRLKDANLSSMTPEQNIATQRDYEIVLGKEMTVRELKDFVLMLKGQNKNGEMTESVVVSAVKGFIEMKKGHDDYYISKSDSFETYLLGRNEIFNELEAKMLKASA